MAATVRAGAFNSTGPTYTDVDSVDSGSFRFGRDDTVVSTTPVPIPTTATSTNYSWRKTLGLYVTAGGGSTSLLNRGVKLASAATTGLYVWFSAVTTYAQASGTVGTAAGNKPADSTSSDGATPTNQTDVSWAALTTTNQSYDTATVATANTTVNGKYCALVFGVGTSFAGGGGAATLPSVVFQYDEQ